jgi:hypothetical protein
VNHPRTTRHRYLSTEAHDPITLPAVAQRSSATERTETSGSSPALACGAMDLDSEKSRTNALLWEVCVQYGWCDVRFQAEAVHRLVESGANADALVDAILLAEGAQLEHPHRGQYLRWLRTGCLTPKAEALTRLCRSFDRERVAAKMQGVAAPSSHDGRSSRRERRAGQAASPPVASAPRAVLDVRGDQLTKALLVGGRVECAKGDERQATFRAHHVGGASLRNVDEVAPVESSTNVE